MIDRRSWALRASLLAIGFSWGLSIPLTKLAVSTGYQFLGLLFWQLFVMSIILGVICHFFYGFGRLSRRTIWVILAIAVFGAILPNSVSYIAYQSLPAGVMAIIIATVPIFALPMSAILGIEAMRRKQVLGVLIGFSAVLLLVVPTGSAAGAIPILWLGFALLAPACYAIEDNTIAALGLREITSVQALFWASLFSLVVITPFSLLSGHYFSLWKPWGVADFALLGSICCHMIAYIGFIRIVATAGAVFASQTAYFVTGFGVLISALLLGESYSPYFWPALAFLGLALYLASPRDEAESAT